MKGSRTNSWPRDVFSLTWEMVWISCEDVGGSGCGTQSVWSQGRHPLSCYSGYCMLSCIPPTLWMAYKCVLLENGIIATSHPIHALRRYPMTALRGRLCMGKVGMLELQMGPLSLDHPISQNVYDFWEAPSRSRKADPVPGTCVSLPEGGVGPVFGTDLHQCPPLPHPEDLHVSRFAPDAGLRVHRRVADHVRVPTGFRRGSIRKEPQLLRGLSEALPGDTLALSAGRQGRSWAHSNPAVHPASSLSYLLKSVCVSGEEVFLALGFFTSLLLKTKTELSVWEKM